jgi:Flp pilus assembly protein TadD
MDEALADLSVAVALAPGLRVPEVELPPEDERRVRLRGLALRAEYYPRRQIESALALARELRLDGDVAAAAEVLEPHAEHPQVAIENARWDLEVGDAATALVRLESVVARAAYPRRIRARAWSLLAVARDETGDPEGALEAAHLALELDSTSPMPFVTLASLAQRRGDHESALAHLRRAWGMAPTDVSLLSRIAAVAYRAGKPADALLALERAVELEPDEPHHVVSLVTIQLETGRYTEAALTLSRAADRFPTDGELLRLAERLRRDVGIR